MPLPCFEDLNPGIEPMEYNILVLVDETEKTTAGGIIIPEKSKDRDDLAQVRGMLVRASPLAFSYDTWPAGSQQPQLGDHIIFGKFAGILVNGDDGREYRLCKDKELSAITRRASMALKAAA